MLDTRHSADDRVATDAYKLVDRREASEDGPIPDRDMTHKYDDVAALASRRFIPEHY